jgi:hypothetical protein
MGRKLRVALLAFALATTVLSVANVQALPDLQFGGDIYICDNSQPLNGTAWEDTTNFAIWVNNSTSTPPFYMWTRYPSSGWLVTSKGYYSAVLPYADKGVKWSNGGEYRVEIAASAINPNYKDTNATSNGTGSVVTTGGGIPGIDNNPEYSDFGNVSNNISYWEWGMPVQTDDFQKWDIIINCVDLIPTDVFVDYGTGPQGPFSGVPSVQFTVPQSTAVDIDASVRNVATSFVNRPTTIAFWNETSPDSGIIDWFNIGATAPVPANSNVVPSPNTAQWPGATSPGTYDLYVTVDFPGTFTEYNVTDGNPPNYGNVTETVDTDLNLPRLQFLYPTNTNNTMRVRILVEGPDLTPNTVSVTTDFGTFTYDYLTQGCPQTSIPVSPNHYPVYINVTATNVGFDMPGGDTFTIAYYNTTAFAGPRSSPSSFYNSPPQPSLANGGVSGMVSEAWEAPSTPGGYYINITVDNATYPNTGAVSEMNDTNLINNNNTCPLWLQVQGPDVIPGTDVPTFPTDIEVDGIDVTGATGSPPMSDTVTVGNGTVHTISSIVTNIGVGGTGVQSTLSFYNCSATGTLWDYLGNFTTPILPSLGSAPSESIVWQAPAALNNNSWVCIEVDLNNDIVEGNELNNVYIIHFLTSTGWPDLRPYDVIVGNNITINGASYTPPMTGNISINLTTGQVVNVTTYPSNDGNLPSGPFQFGYFDNETGQATIASTPTTFYNISALGLQSVYPTPLSYIKYYMDEAKYYIFLEVDYSDMVNEQTPADEGNNRLIIEVNVFELPPPPVLTLDANDDAGNVTASWGNVTGEDIVSFNIYWATSIESFDFTTPDATILATGTALSYVHAGGVGLADELFYVVRSVDSRGWEGPSSDIAAKFTMAIPPGYSTFSLPLEPFTTNAVSWYLEDMDLEEHDVIFRFDSSEQMWIPHPRFLPPEVSTFDLMMGETYMVFAREGRDDYTFVGKPGTTLKFLDVINAGTNLEDRRLGTDASFRSGLMAAEVGDDIMLTWSWEDSWNETQILFESLAGFNIYRAESRGEFDFSTPYASLTGFDLSWTDTGAQGDEYYYMLIPVNEIGREGSGALAIGVKRVTFGHGYSGFALFLEQHSSEAGTLSSFLDGMNLTEEEQLGALFYFTSGTETWIPHPAFLESGISDPQTGLSDGNMIYLLRSRVYTFVGK